MWVSPIFRSPMFPRSPRPAHTGAFFGPHVLSPVPCFALVEILDCALQPIALFSRSRSARHTAIIVRERRGECAIPSLRSCYSTPPYYPMDLCPRVLYRPVNSAKVLFPSKKAEERGVMLFKRCCAALLATAAASCAGYGDGLSQHQLLYFIELHGFL
jgi:hypothetical protein